MYTTFTVCGDSVFAFVLLCINFVLFLVCNHLGEVLCFDCLSDVTVRVLWLFLMMQWVDLHCVIVV